MITLKLQILTRVISTCRYHNRASALTCSHLFVSRRNFAVVRACSDLYHNLVRRSSSRATHSRVDKREYLPSSPPTKSLSNCFDVMYHMFARVSRELWDHGGCSLEFGGACGWIRCRMRALTKKKGFAGTMRFVTLAHRFLNPVRLQLQALPRMHLFSLLPSLSSLPSIRHTLHRPCARARWHVHSVARMNETSFAPTRARAHRSAGRRFSESCSSLVND